MTPEIITEVSNRSLSSSKQLLNLYVLYREAGKIFGDKLLELIPKEVIMNCGKRLGIVRRKAVVIGNDSELPILFDYCLFHNYVNGKNLIDRFIAYRLSELNINEQVVALAMQQASFALLGVIKTLPHGGVLVKDLLRDGRQELLLDKGFSSSAKPGLILASTIVRYPEFIMTTGAALPINSLVDELSYLLTEFGHKYDNFDDMSRQDKSKFIANLLKIGLEAGVSESIKYQDY